MDDAYPNEWLRLDGFAYLSDLSLMRLRTAVRTREGADANYIVQHAYTCAVEVDGVRHLLEAPRGFITDLTSVPPLFRVFVGRVGPWLEGAVLHDWLYVAWRLEPDRGVRSRDRLFADRVFLLAMEAAGVRRWRRWAIYAAVRLFGRSFYENTEGPILADLGAPPPNMV